MLRRLHPDQPDSFAFTPANQAWAEGQITKYPDGRQPSAIIPLLFRAQEQEGWLSRAAIEHVADMLGMAHIRALEVATFYFMFQLQPVGSVAHIQVCGTTSCMICGAEDLIEVCKKLIAENPHEVSEDGKLSWEEVECLGSCTNAPMAQIGKDYYEDLTTESFRGIIEDLRAGKVPAPGPQNGRMASEPRGGLTTLKEFTGDHDQNASVALATSIGDTVKRIDGSEVPLLTPWTKGKDAADLAKPLTTPSAEPVIDVSAEPDLDEAEAAAAGDVVVDVSSAPGSDDEGAVVVDVSSTPGSDDEGDVVVDVSSTPGSDDEGDVVVDVSSTPGSDDEGDVVVDVSSTPGDDGEGDIVVDVSSHEEHEEADHMAEAAEEASEESQPEILSGPREGGADDLKQLKGVGPKLEQTLNELGFFHFDQIASWTAAEVAWVDSRLSFKGRIERDGWIEQAKTLAGGGTTEFANKVKDGDVY